MWLLRWTIKATGIAVPDTLLPLNHRIPVEAIGWGGIAPVLTPVWGCRPMLGDEMRFHDLMPLLALGDRWCLAT
jgi:hypothetical protein